MRKRQGIAIDDGLNAIASNAMLEPVMRTVARLALERGMTLGSLAKRWNDAFGASLSASNVRRHFEAERSSESTVERYAAILGLNADDIAVIAGEAEIAAARVGPEIRKLRRLISLVVGDFEPAELQKVEQLLDEADTALLRTIATQHRRTSSSHGADALIASFQGIYDLRPARRQPSADEVTLWEIWISASGRLTREEASSLVALTIGLLRLRGVDTAPMESRLTLEIAAMQELNSEALRA